MEGYDLTLIVYGVCMDLLLHLSSLFVSSLFPLCFLFTVTNSVWGTHHSRLDTSLFFSLF
jgi:hypothetical protein